LEELTPIQLNMLRRAAVGDILRRTARRHPDRVAVRFKNVTLTFKDLNEKANRFANAVSRLGVGKGDRVAIISHNCHQYAYCWFGLTKIGAIITPLNFMLRGSEIGYIINHSEPKMFFVEDSLIETVKNVPEKMESVQYFGCIKLGEGTKPEGWLDFDELVEEGSSVEPEVEIHENEPASLLYTSGTEAAPKGVLNTHLNYYSTILSSQTDCDFRPDDVFLLSIPLYHVAGLHILLAAVNVGAKTVIQYLPEVEEILQLIEKEKVTQLVYPATLFVKLIQHPDVEKYDLSSVKKCLTFGSLMPSAIYERYKKLMPQAVWRNYYGQTELSPLGTTLQPEDFERKPTSIGKPHLTVEIRIVDDEDKDVPPGQMGEIVARSPSVMLGYFKDEERTKKAFRGGWLHTGDYGYMDEEGYLYFVDRKKDIIKSGGENVSSQEVEEVIFKHPKVAEAAVVGVPHPYWMEAVTAVIVPKKDVQVTSEEIIQYCKEKLAGYKVPKYVVFVDELPKNPSGKILKRVLREKFKDLAEKT